MVAGIDNGGRLSRCEKFRLFSDVLMNEVPSALCTECLNVSWGAPSFYIGSSDTFLHMC